jgi:hypothetical protein
MKDLKMRNLPDRHGSGDVDHLIMAIRGQRVILDSDLAALYGVSTKRLNEQVKRNEDRFPADFAFLLTMVEKAEVVANCDHLERLKFPPVLPRAFTEHGAIMAGRTVALVTLERDRVRPLQAGDIPHVREFAAA